MELPSTAHSRNTSVGRASRRSASRGSQLNYRELSGVRPVTRGRSHTVGSRRLQRWLNDNMVYLYGNFWDGLTEYEFQERLAHMYVDITKKPSIFEELQSMEEDTKEMFRDGTLGIPQLVKSSGPRRLTIRGALEHMYVRMYTRCRTLLLKEARRSNNLMDAGSDIQSITTDIEHFMTLLLDGKLANIIAKFAKESKDSTDELNYSPFPCGPEFESCLVSNMRAYRRTMTHGHGDNTSEMTGVEEPMSQLNIGGSTVGSEQGVHDEHSHVYDWIYEVPIVDGYSRMLFIGLAQFYGVNFEVLENPDGSPDTMADHAFDSMFPSAKVIRFWVHRPTKSLPSEQNNVEVVLAVRRQLHSAMWAAATHDDDTDASGSEEESDHEDAPLETANNPTDTHPFVPLFAVHVRTITEESTIPRKHKRQFTYGSRFRARQPQPQEHMYRIPEPQDVQMVTENIAHMSM